MRAARIVAGVSERYTILGELASGGMASVLYGRLKGPVGFARAVAIKRLHPHIAREPDFVSMFIDEARICARLSHVNIVPTIDVIEAPSELCLVMEYVHGAALASLLDVSRHRHEAVPVPVAVGLIVGVLHGLHAAHEARDDAGESLQVVHRDVSPQNVLVGEDGVARVLDFGIARAVNKLRTTPSGEVKGKLAYMAPEQFRGKPVDRRVDVHGAAAVLWETLAGRPLFEGDNESAIVYRVLNDELVPPSRERAEVPPELDAIVMRALARDPDERFATAREMALALERQVGGASQSEISEWVRALVGSMLDARAADLRRLQQNEERDAGGQSVAPGATRRLVPTSAQSSAPAHADAGKKRALLFALASLLLGLAGAWWALSPRAPVPVAATPTVQERAPAPSELEPAARVQAATDAAPPALSAPLSPEPKTERRAHRNKRVAAPPVAPTPDPQCSPPYWWSPDGVKHFKRECL